MNRLMITTVRADIFPVQMLMHRNYRLALSEQENKNLGFENPAGLYVCRKYILYTVAKRSAEAFRFSR